MQGRPRSRGRDVISIWVRHDQRWKYSTYINEVGEVENPCDDVGLGISGPIEAPLTKQVSEKGEENIRRHLLLTLSDHREGQSHRGEGE